MRQLRTCDFCGDEAVGTFEIVPSELNPSEAEQRRVVLCADCQPTLEDLLEPLLVRAGAAASTDARERTDATGSDSARDGRAETTTDTDGGPSHSVASDRSPATDTDPSGTPGLDRSDSDDDGSLVPDAVVTPDTDDVPAPGTGDGVAIGGERDTDTGANDAGASETERETGTESDAEETTAAGTTEAGARGAADDTPGAPRAYGKVLRLLQNREFPMARSDVEALAGSAYDLEDHEVTAIINHAVKQGDFELEGRQIRLG